MVDIFYSNLQYGGLDTVEIMPKRHRNAPAWTQGRGEPRHGRRVLTVSSSIETLQSIISYSILATQRSDGGNTCAPMVPGACVPYY